VVAAVAAAVAAYIGGEIFVIYNLPLHSSSSSRFEKNVLLKYRFFMC